MRVQFNHFPNSQIIYFNAGDIINATHNIIDDSYEIPTEHILISKLAEHEGEYIGYLLIIGEWTLDMLLVESQDYFPDFNPFGA